MQKTKGLLCFVATQYTAWIMSMVLIFSSIAPSWARGSLKPRTARKGLSALTRQNVNIQVNPVLDNSLNRAVVTAMQRPVSFSVAGGMRTSSIPVINSALQKSSVISMQQLDAAHVPAEFKGLVQIYKQTQQLIKQGENPSLEILRPQMTEALDLVEAKLAQVEQTAATSPYVERVRSLLNQVKEVLKMERAAAKQDIENLCQSVRELYERMFNDPQLQPAFARANTLMPQGSRMLTPEELFGGVKEAYTKQMVLGSSVAIFGGLLIRLGWKGMENNPHMADDPDRELGWALINLGAVLFVVGLIVMAVEAKSR